MVRTRPRQGGLVSPICKNTSPHSYGSAKNESPGALGYNGVAEALKEPGEGREHAPYNGKQKPLKDLVEEVSDYAW